MKKTLSLLLGVLLSLPSLAQHWDNEKIDTLNAAVVQTDKQKKAARSQTSLKTLDNRLIRRGFAVLGTPDLVKTLQILPGVSAGTELMSGMYVRGGDGSDNLFLLDGVPMYQVSHVVGLFSSFNTDMIDEVDFYKGGFPARYGGRLSSVVDVGIKEGSFSEWKGSASLGIIDGRLQIEGPVIKDKLSINAGIRRTWLDVAKYIGSFFLEDELSQEMLRAASYNFSDINLKLVQKFNADSKLSLSCYYGHDHGGFKLTETLLGVENDDRYITESDLFFKLKWGNTLASLRWERRLPSRDILFDASAYYTNYTTDMVFDGNEHDVEKDEAGKVVSDARIRVYERNFGRIHDIGANTNIYINGLPGQRLRFGTSFVGHIYDPFREMSVKISSFKKPVYSEGYDESTSYLGGELALYAEDEISVEDLLKLNLGLRENLFFVKNKVYSCLEPRAALRCDLSESFLLKCSYSITNQFTHQLAACYLDLPTNIWMPSTAQIKPMKAEQIVAGFKWSLPFNLSFDVELWYKNMFHLYEYAGSNSMLPQIEKWEKYYHEGKGRSYGAEFGVEYSSEHVFAALYYTLSRSERLFPSFYFDWYPDRNDNLHKLNLHAQYRFNKRFELYASWTYHTGNRFTSITAVGKDGIENEGGDIFVPNQIEVYDMPNRYRMPDYMRLDAGLNWHRKFRNGHTRTLTLSVYNVTNRLNAVMAFLDVKEDKVKGYAYGLIPIIPSLSYYWTF